MHPPAQFYPLTHYHTITPYPCFNQRFYPLVQDRRISWRVWRRTLQPTAEVSMATQVWDVPSSREFQVSIFAILYNRNRSYPRYPRLREGAKRLKIFYCDLSWQVLVRFWWWNVSWRRGKMCLKNVVMICDAIDILEFQGRRWYIACMEREIMRDGRGRGYLRRVIAALADCAYYTKLIPSCSTKMVSGLWGNYYTKKYMSPAAHT